jgi:hypothetical protein
MTFLAGSIVTAQNLEEETNNKPLCIVYNSVTQSITSGGAPQSMTANSERQDWSVAAMHSTSVNTSRITIQKAGLYRLAATITFPTNTTGRRAIELWVNNSAQYRIGQVPPVSGGETTVPVSLELDLAVSDYVEIRAFQDSGIALSCTLVAFSATYLRD